MVLIDSADQQTIRTVPLYARVDVIGGILLVMIAVLIWYGAIELEVGTIADLKSGALPMILSIALGLLGAGVFIEGLFQGAETSEGFALRIRPAALIILSITVFGLFIRGGAFGPVSTPQLGLLIVGPLTVFISGCAADAFRLKSLLVLAFGLTSALLLIFVDLLSVNIPVYPKPVAAFLYGAIGEYPALRGAYVFYALVALALYAIFYMLPERSRG